MAPATMAPAEGLGAATHDGTTTEGNGAVGADGDGVGAADISYLATRSADAEKLRRSSSRDVECDSPRPVRKAVPERFATEKTLGTVSMFSPGPKPSTPAPNFHVRQSSFNLGSTPATSTQMKTQISVLRAEVSAHRLTHQGIRKVLTEATDLPQDDTPAMAIIRRANSLLDYAESMIDENKDDAARGEGADARPDWRASIPANAREFLSQYDHSGGEGFFHAVQMAKVAYDAKLRREDTFKGTRSTHSISNAADPNHHPGAASPMHPAFTQHSVDSWDGFDALALATDLRESRQGDDAGGGPSSVLARTVRAVVDGHGLLDPFPNVDSFEFKEFLTDLEAGYDDDNDYHTATHAADVVQACGFFLSTGLARQLSGTQALAFILAAAAHDVGHPGLNNAHLVSTEASEAVRWNDVSVNENGHYHVLRVLLTKRGLLDAMFAKKEEKLAFLATLRRLILATDMENHTRLVADFLDIVQAAHDERGAGGEDAALSVSDLSDPTLAICFTLHCADVSNPARPFETCRRWGECIAEESYKQGDKERQLGMRAAAFCDRELSTPTTTAQNQVSFIDFVCGPMVEGLSAILPDAAEELLHHLAVNREKYGAIIGELRS